MNADTVRNLILGIFSLAMALGLFGIRRAVDDLTDAVEALDVSCECPVVVAEKES